MKPTLKLGLAAALLNGSAVFIAHGGWDLGDQLPREARRKGITLPEYLASACYTDLKVLFALEHPELPTSLRGMLQVLDLEQVRPPLRRCPASWRR